jgi:hypothetical protein
VIATRGRPRNHRIIPKKRRLIALRTSLRPVEPLAPQMIHLARSGMVSSPIPGARFMSLGSIPGLEVLFGEFAKLVGYGPKTFQSD